MIKITFPDGSVREYAKGITGYEIAESISQRLAQEVLVCSVNDEITELNRPIMEDASIKLHKWEDEEAKHAYWHTSAHLMAEAIQELWPGTQFGIGPAIEKGFYYDIMPPEGVVIKESDFSTIEAKMQELIQRKEKLIREEISKPDALKFFASRGQSYKNELIAELEDGTITTYTQGNYTDLCRGPHLVDTSAIKAIKLTATSAAYWRGDEKRPQMTRIYGISFPKKKMLDEYLELILMLYNRTPIILHKTVYVFCIGNISNRILIKHHVLNPVPYIFFGKINTVLTRITGRKRIYQLLLIKHRTVEFDKRSLSALINNRCLYPPARNQ
jgi:threonyl-tRNA synthetase